jgi:hypothetical protein
MIKNLSKTSVLTIVLCLVFMTQPSLQWSKCKSLECKSCTNKGCVKCKNLWADYNYNCVVPVGNKISFCLHEYEIPAVTPGTDPTRRCTVCQHGYRLDSTFNCVAVGSVDCYAGEFTTVN